MKIFKAGMVFVFLVGFSIGLQAQTVYRLNDLKALSKDPTFNFLVASAPFNQNWLESMRKVFNMKDFSANEKDFIVVTNNQSLDDLMQKKKMVVRFGAIRVIELKKNSGVSSNIRAFTTAGAAGKFRSGVYENLAILSKLKPLAGTKDYLSHSGKGCEAKTGSQSGRNFIKDKRGQYMDGEGGGVSEGGPAPDEVWADENGIHETYTHQGGVREIVTTNDSGRVVQVTVQDLESGAGQTTVFARRDPPAVQQTVAPQSKTKKDDKDKDKDSAKADDAPDAEPASEPESAPEDSAGGGTKDDATPLPDGTSGGGDILWRCRMHGTTAKDCRKELRGKLGSNDPLVQGDERGKSSGYRFEGHRLQSRSAHNTHVGFNAPYIIPTDEGGRGHSSIEVDPCGGGIVSGRTVGNTFCHRVADGSSRCDGGGSAPVAPRGGTEPGDNPVPNPGPGPRPRR